MKTRKKMYSIPLASIALFLFLILISSTASASTVQDISSAGPYAYITNYQDGNVSIIDTTNNTVTATVSVGQYPWGITVTPDGSKVYVTNYGSNNVSVIDTASNTVAATVKVGSGPRGVAVNPDGTKVYVTNYVSKTVSIIDTANNTVTDTVFAGKGPRGVIISPDGTRVYVTNYNKPGTVSVIDTGTSKVTATVSVGNYPMGVAVNPDGTKVYVANYNKPGTVSVIDTATNTVTATVNVENYPIGVAVNPSGTEAYVTNSRSSAVSVIDTSADKVTARVPVGMYPEGVSITPDGTKIYVVNSCEDGTVSVIDAANNTVTATVNVGNSPVAFGQFIGPLPVQPVLPVANFSNNVTSGYAPLPVQFTDLSTNITEWSWDFGDGSNSTEQNPTHTYSAAGNYTVNLIVSNENGTDSKLATINVTEKPVSTSAWEFSPQEPVCGDTLNMKGSASPGEKVDVFATFEKTVPVSDGKFEYNLKDVIIPEGFNNFFTVEAIGAKNLNVRVKMIVWVTKSSEASGYTAIVSQSNVPPGTYKIKIDGNAEEGVSEVNLKITAFQSIKADSNGDFSYSYNTKAVPPGEFKVKIKGNEKKIILKPEEIEKPSLVLPVANFSSNVTEGYVPLSVQFTDLSENETLLYWNFGDGSNSTEKNPIHTYSTAGNYTVNLIVSNENGTDSKLTAINVTEKTSSLPLIANFSANTTEGYAPLSVQFTDLSEDAASVSWDFENDGIADSVERNPVHEYRDSGNYTVNLTVTNGNDITSKTATINVIGRPAVLPTSNFSSNVTSGSAPLSVQFTDLSENVAEWNWDFGDGYNSTEQNPVHTYSTAGEYTVTLTVDNSAGSDTVTKYSYITVVKSDNVIIEGHAPLTVQFTDLSKDANSWKWSFGDGNTSTEQNPIHTYSKPGQYTVTLTVNNAGGNGAVIKYSYINVTDPLKAPVADFSASVT